MRFNVKPLIWLENLEEGLPIDDKHIWSNLSFTKELPKKSPSWTSMVRGSLHKLGDIDGQFLEQSLQEQEKIHKKYAISETDQRKLKALSVKNQDSKQIEISIPENDKSYPVKETVSNQRESIR